MVWQTSHREIRQSGVSDRGPFVASGDAAVGKATEASAHSAQMVRGHRATHAHRFGRLIFSDSLTVCIRRVAARSGAPSPACTGWAGRVLPLNNGQIKLATRALLIMPNALSLYSGKKGFSCARYCCESRYSRYAQKGSNNLCP